MKQQCPDESDSSSGVAAAAPKELSPQPAPERASLSSPPLLSPQAPPLHCYRRGRRRATVEAAETTPTPAFLSFLPLSSSQPPLAERMAAHSPQWLSSSSHPLFSHKRCGKPFLIGALYLLLFLLSLYRIKQGLFLAYTVQRLWLTAHPWTRHARVSAPAKATKSKGSPTNVTFHLLPPSLLLLLYLLPHHQRETAKSWLRSRSPPPFIFHFF